MLEEFLLAGSSSVRHPAERSRMEALVSRWTSAWTGKERVLDFTHSSHGTFLHFNQRIGGHWCQVCYFHASPRHGVSLRGPDPDRARKSHKYRRNKLDPSKLDGLFERWCHLQGARPAGLAVEFFLEETPDETWDACFEALREILG